MRFAFEQTNKRVSLTSAASSYWADRARNSRDDGFVAELRESFVRLFDPNGEANVIAWYSASTLLLCALLLGVITVVRKGADKPYVAHWAALSLTFLYLSVDEAALLHEMAVEPLRSRFGFGGLLYYAWVIPAGLAVLVFVAAFRGFLIHLPRTTAKRFVLAGGIFVSGAIGMESISGLLDDWYAQGRIASDRHVIAFETVEEFMEMAGIVVFVHALLDYIGSEIRHLHVAVTNSPGAPEGDRLEGEPPPKGE